MVAIMAFVVMVDILWYVRESDPSPSFRHLQTGLKEIGENQSLILIQPLPARPVRVESFLDGDL